MYLMMSSWESRFGDGSGAAGGTTEGFLERGIVSLEVDDAACTMEGGGWGDRQGMKRRKWPSTNTGSD